MSDVAFSTEAETVTLATFYGNACGQEKDRAYDILTQVVPKPIDLFWNQTSREAFRRIEAAILDGRNVTAGLLVKQVEGLPFEVIARITDSQWRGTLDMLEFWYLPELVKLADNRRAQEAARKMAELAGSATTETAAQIKALLDEMKPTEPRKNVDVKRRASREVIADWEWASQNKGKYTGIACGLPDVDAVTWGWQKEHLIVIGARPSQGKSALLFQFAEHAALDLKVPTLVFTLESSAKEAIKRIICGRAGLCQSDLRAGEMTSEDATKILMATEAIAKAPLYFVETPGLTIGQIQQEARRFVKDKGIRLILLDYIQKVRADVKNEKRTYEVAQVTEGLKTMAKEHAVPIIAAAQLNREPDKDGKKGRAPRLADFGDSGQIERDADVAGLIWHDFTEKNGQKTVDTWLLIAKNRDGDTPPVKLYFNRPIARFQSVTKITREEVPETYRRSYVQD